MTINAVPAVKGISTRFAPREIVTERRLDLKHIKTGFGDYIEASTDEIVTHGIKGCIHGYISLGPSGNWQGSQVCSDLETSIVVLCRNIKVLPTPDSVIQVINDWGKSYFCFNRSQNSNLFLKSVFFCDLPHSLIT